MKSPTSYEFSAKIFCFSFIGMILIILSQIPVIKTLTHMVDFKSITWLEALVTIFVCVLVYVTLEQVYKKRKSK